MDVFNKFNIYILLVRALHTYLNGPGANMTYTRETKVRHAIAGCGS